MKIGKQDVEQTARVIDDAAKIMRERAVALERIAANMRSRSDLTYAAEALSEIVNCPASCRVDLLIVRPLREFGL